MDKLRTYIILGLVLAVPSGYGLYWLIMNTLPYLKERWLFFFLLILFVTAVTLPIFAALNKYFFTIHRIFPAMVVREAVVSGLLCALLVWFQIGRVLNSAVIFLCVGGFILVELIMRTRDSVKIRPGIDDQNNNIEA